MLNRHQVKIEQNEPLAKLFGLTLDLLTSYNTIIIVF